MPESVDFFKCVLDAIVDHVAVIDKQGNIIFVNESWTSFGYKNGLVNSSQSQVNYLYESDKAAAMGDEFGIKASAGIREVITNKRNWFQLEYPCHSPNESRWFIMRVSKMEQNNYFVITHQNITERKLIEEQMAKISRLDGLTNIANRRFFDEFLEHEWLSCRRLKQPLSLAIIDVDNFKMLNDTYGHQKGDECLKAIANTLTKFSKRPGDMPARYGGDEFVLLLGNTSLKDAEVLLSDFQQVINLSNISHTKHTVTLSIGLATIYPSSENDTEVLLCKSDELLYLAKRKGKNQICSN